MSTPAAETVLLYPGDDPGSVAVLAENIRDGSRQLTLLSDGVGDARSSLHAAWKGEDADAADREIDTVVTICAALIERVNTAATAVDTHHADLVRIRAAIAQLREQWTTVRSALESLLLQELFAPSWRTPVMAPSATAPPINIGGFTMLSAAEVAQQRQAKIDSYEQDLTDLQTTWQGLVDEQETSAATCRAALDNAASGGWTYIVGTGIARAELGTALGLDALLFDDRERARVAALTIPGQGWDELSPQEQAFYRGLAASEFSTPLVLGSTSMIPDLWSDLDPLAQQALIHDQSSMIGNLDGIPADARDQANRITLDTFLSDARNDVLAAGASLPGSDVNPHGAGQAEQIESALRAAGYSDEQIKAVRGAMEVQYQLDTRIPSRATLPDALPVELLIFDPEAYGGKGRAAISIGDVATAENVAMLVPGMTSEVPGYMDSQTGDALNLYERSSLFSDSTAVVAYVGYDAPGIDLGVTGQDKSDAGGKVVAADISGLHAMTQAPDGRLTVIAHSYGSTTTATAFADNGASADNLVLIGSPGAGRADTAAEITGVPAGHVFVGSASSDPVTTIVQQAQDPNQAGLTGLKAGWHFGSEVGGRGPNSNIAVGVVGAVGGMVVADKAQDYIQPYLGVDPAGDQFGGVRIHTETQNDSLYEFGNHSEYYRPGSESLSNLAQITVGGYGNVGVAEARPEDGVHYEGHDPEADHTPPTPK